MSDNLEAPGTDDHPDWGSIYRARGPEVVTFEISSRFTRDEAEKNRLVEFYTTKAQFPVKVTESPIEHWSENPLFADEHGTEGAR